ncbi:MAG: NUDIX hydrolase [Caulobacterales bacterium]
MADALAPWRLLSSRTLVQDRWLTVRADTLETSEGTRIDPCYVIEQPDAVAIVAVTPDQHLVLVRQHRHPFGAATLEFPAGHMEPGEDPIAAALRELEEETGYRAANARLLRTVQMNPVRNTNALHVVMAAGAAPIGQSEDNPHERTAAALWPLSNAAALFHDPSFVSLGNCGVLGMALHAFAAQETGA